MMPFRGNKQKVEVQTCACCACTAHMQAQATHSICSRKLTNKKGHNPTLKKVQKQGEVPLPILSPSHIPKFYIWDETEDASWHSLLLLSLFDRWSTTGHCFELKGLYVCKACLAGAHTRFVASGTIELLCQTSCMSDLFILTFIP